MNKIDFTNFKMFTLSSPKINPPTKKGSNYYFSFLNVIKTGRKIGKPRGDTRMEAIGIGQI